MGAHPDFPERAWKVDRLESAIQFVDDSPTDGPGRAILRPSPSQSQIAQPSTLSPRPISWWNGVTTGDLDGDGRMDIVASNWGRNSK